MGRLFSEVCCPDRFECALHGLLRGLDNIANIPALLLSHRLDVLATNHLARALYLYFDVLPVEARNMAHYLFLNPAARDLYVDWPETGREIVGMLHFQASRHPHDPQLSRLIGELSSGDRDFRRWWADQDVFKPRHGSKHYRHPVVGDLILGYESFTPIGDPDQTLGLYTRRIRVTVRACTEQAGLERRTTMKWPRRRPRRKWSPGLGRSATDYPVTTSVRPAG